MATRPRSEELLRETFDAWIANDKNAGAAARSLGRADSTFKAALDECKAKGMHLSDGAQRAVSNAGLSGTEARGGWIHNYDDEGKKTGTTRWNAPEISAEDAIDRIRTAMDGLLAAPVVPAPLHTESDLLTLYPLADVHLGMQAWGKETGEDYDTEIAAERVRSWVAQCVASSPASETAIILGVGDMTHADDQTSMTPKSKHILDVDTRHFKTLEVSISALATAIETAAAKHKRVIVRILPGNHDPHTYMAIMFALSERYRDDKRIAVQKVPGEFFAHEFGKVMIASHHGDKAKADRLVMFLADTYPELWGRTKHRFLFTGHLHHHKSQDIGGVQWEQLRAVTAKDAYAVAHGYSARAQLQAVTFHRERGEVSRVKVSA
jgi:hypothetical protein